VDTIDATATWIDKLAIRELVELYADGVNRADWEQVRGVFAPECVWESPALQLYFGTAAEFCDFLAETGTTQQLLIQTPHCTVVKLTSPDSATATTTLHEFSLGTSLADGPLGAKGSEINFEDYGIYYDTVARLGGEWRFTHRVFLPLYLDFGRVTGSIVTPRISIPAQGLGTA
jgi:SnoaL-like domain